MSKTLPDFIRDHRDSIDDTEELMRRQTHAERRFRESYRAIRDTLMGDGARGFAVVDRDTEYVYYLQDGLVMSQPFLWSDDSSIGKDISQSETQDTIITVGEAS